MCLPPLPVVAKTVEKITASTSGVSTEFNALKIELVLWTVKGALMHAKSLGTNETWEVSEKLVDD